jgi:hypothetical protein
MRYKDIDTRPDIQRQIADKQQARGTAERHIRPAKNARAENKGHVGAVDNNRERDLESKAARRKGRILNEVASDMRLTLEQRVAALERESVVLSDTIKLLHKLLREQRRLISDYITQHVMSANQSDEQEGNLRPEDALYTFVCRRRFEALEKQVERICKFVENQKFGLKAG